METKTIYDHDSDNTLDALGVDREKLDLMKNHLELKHEEKKFHAISQEIAEIIKLGSSVEEIALMAYGLGKNSAGDALKEFMLKTMMGDLLEDLIDNDEDEDEDI
jgi:hypothetical protein